jgi:hypothetical protein
VHLKIKLPIKIKLPKIPIDHNDIFVLAGAGLVAAGIWQIYQPAAFIAVGLGLLWLGLPRTRSKK